MLSEREARDLDVLVAERVFGWRRYGATRYGKPCVVLVAKHADCWNYTRTQSDPGSWVETTEPVTESVRRFSTDTVDALRVLDEVMKDAFAYVLYANHSDGFACTFESSDGKEYRATAYSLPHAICLAALAVSEARSLQSSRGSQK